MQSHCACDIIAYKSQNLQIKTNLRKRTVTAKVIETDNNNNKKV